MQNKKKQYIQQIEKALKNEKYVDLLHTALRAEVI